MKDIKRLMEILYRCTFDRNRRAWRDCYVPVGGITDVAGHRTLLIIWADWALAAAFVPLPAVRLRRVHR